MQETKQDIQTYFDSSTMSLRTFISLHTKQKRLNKSETVDTKRKRKEKEPYFIVSLRFSFLKRFSVGSRSSLSQLTCLVGFQLKREKIF